jgi:hypothetical protein
MTVQVSTPYGDRYNVDCDTGRLTYIRRNGPTTEGSDKWLIVGIATVRGRWLHGGLSQLEILANMPQNDVVHKNGTPRFTLCDRDHGTLRMHGNTKAHGIRSVQRLS